MPRFSPTFFDHRMDNAVINKEDLRFHDPETAEEFAETQYLTDFIPRSVIKGASGLHLVLENPTHEHHPNEVAFINSNVCEG